MQVGTIGFTLKSRVPNQSSQKNWRVCWREFGDEEGMPFTSMKMITADFPGNVKNLAFNLPE